MVNKSLLNFYSDKRVLITGHTGFKGSWLSYILDQNNAIVKGYALNPITNPSLFFALDFSNKFKSIISNIKDYETLEKEILEFKPDFIFHMAAQPLVLESYKDPYETFDTNFNGTLNLLEILKTNNLCTNLIIITSDKVYKNEGFTAKYFKENDTLGGNDPYSASKAVTEILVHSYIKSFFENSKIKVTTVRAGNVIGGGDWSEDRLLPDIIRAFMHKTVLKIRNPNSTRPWQHVLDSLFAYLRIGYYLSNNDLCNFGSWNFGPKEKSLSVSDILNICENEGLFLDIDYVEIENNESKFLSLDSNKSRKILDWQSKWNSQEAVVHSISWYKDFIDGVNPSKLVIRDLNQFIGDD